MFSGPLHWSFRSFNLPCRYVEPGTAAARRQRKGYANYPRVVLDKLLSQALKSKKKSIQRACGFFFLSGGMCRRSAPERSFLRLWEGYWSLFPMSKADVRKAPPPPFRGSSSKHTHAHSRTPACALAKNRHTSSRAVLADCQ